MSLNKIKEIQTSQRIVQIIHPNYLDEIKFSFIRQSEPNGLGHAILQAKHIITDDFFGIMS